MNLLMFQDINQWVAACPKCSRIKSNDPKRAGLLQPIITTKPFELVAADIMGPLTIWLGHLVTVNQIIFLILNTKFLE